jgi:multiple sugar transport system substrate-binding protein
VLGALALALAMGSAAPLAAQAADSFLDVGKQPDIGLVINASPWLGGFRHAVELYEQQTGNHVNMEVVPYGGLLEKARNAVRGTASPYDIVNLDTQWTIEFYEGGFLEPLAEIEPGYDLPPEVLRYGDSYYWNATNHVRTHEGGELMAVPPNGNVHLFLYRQDLLEQAGLQPPETWADVKAACEKLQDRPKLYGFLTRGERGNPIRYDWTPFLLGEGGSIVQDPENGDFTVTINSPKAKAALDLYIDLLKSCGPANPGAVGQGDVFQLTATGKSLMTEVVAAAWPTFDDPTKSIVVGKLNAAVLPRPVDGQHALAIGNWHLAIPRNIPAERQKAALAFMKWFLTEKAQYAYAEQGGIPVRTDVLGSDLAEKPANRWMKAYLDSMPYAHQVLGYAEGAEVEQALGLRLNQALVGEMSSGQALNAAAKDILAIFQRTGRKTGMLAPLAE